MVTLVTLKGECFEAEYEEVGNAHPRDGVLYYFILKDLVSNRGQRLVSLYRSHMDKIFVQDYDARIDNVKLNVIRRAFDAGELSFEQAPDPHRYKELPLTADAFEPQEPKDEKIIRQFIIHKAYWMSYRYSPEGRHPVQFDQPIESEYLGVSAADVRRNVYFLGRKGLLEKTEVEGFGRPTPLLIDEYEAQAIEVPSDSTGETVATSSVRMDDLLGIPLRGQLDEDLLKLGSASDEKSPFSVLWIDLDHFKTVNDTYGHPIGDEVLKKVTSVISQICRCKGQLYRYGGDELIVVLPNHNLREAAATAERICRAISLTSFVNCPENITASIGVASSPETTPGEPNLLLEEADKAMYEAKDSGGNGVHVSKTPEGEALAAASTTSKPARSDIGSRIDAVELWMSLQHGRHPNFLLLVENNSDDEVTIESITLKRGTLHLCPPSKPAKLDELGLPPHSKKQISSWTPSISPTSTLQMKEPDLKDGQPIEIDIVVRARVLGRVKNFSHTILATVNYPIQSITQFGG